MIKVLMTIYVFNIYVMSEVTTPEKCIKIRDFYKRSRDWDVNCYIFKDVE